MSVRQVYDRDTILMQYRQFSLPSELYGLPITSPQQLNPALTANQIFKHNLGSDPNSRSLPAWAGDRKEGAYQKRHKPPPVNYDQYNSVAIEETKKPEKTKAAPEAPMPKFKLNTRANVQNVPKELQDLINNPQLAAQKAAEETAEVEDEYHNIDAQLETKQTDYEWNVPQEDDHEEDEVPNWDEPEKVQDDDWGLTQPQDKELLRASAFEKWDGKMLKLHQIEGNPFADYILKNSTSEGQFVFVSPTSPPKEAIWYYRDMEGNTHGPYDSVQMYTWFCAKYFPAELQISKDPKGNFRPLTQFTEAPPSPAKAQTLAEIEGAMMSPQKPQKDEDLDRATNDLKSLLGIGGIGGSGGGRDLQSFF